MPTHIKTIKCPQCGSTRATQLREDHYRCDSCSTEFYLDSDDITIHHKFETERNTSTAKFKRFFLVLLAVTVFFSLIIIGLITFGRSREGSLRIGSDEEKISYSIKELATFTTTAGRPIVVIFGSARPTSSSNVDDAKGFVSFFDGETQKLVKKIEFLDVKGRIQNMDMRRFGDGAFYIVFNEAHLYRLDPSTLDMTEVHGEDYKRPELSQGFAKVVFYYSQFGDALKVKTNLGESFVYYPIADKIYTEKEAYAALLEPLPAPKVATHFTFSLKSSDYPNKQLQLIRYRRLEQDGYPCEYPRFQWRSWDGKERLIFPYSEKRARLQGYEDLTPGAYYFSPGVLDASEDQILITFKPTAAADAKQMLRCLDAQTGKVLWSYSDDENNLNGGSVASRFAGGYVVVNYRSSYVISNEGKLVSSTDYRKLIEDRS